MGRDHTARILDAFDLPPWVGEQQVVWTALGSIGTSHLLTGQLSSAAKAGDTGVLDCDVLASDLAYPTPVLSNELRHDVHQAWALGQVCILEYDGRMSLAVPGSLVDSQLTLEAVRRLAKAVGAPARQFSVSLRL